MNARGLLACLAAVCWAGGMAAAQRPPGEAWDRLEAGEVVPREIAGNVDGGSARMQILVRAPARAVWNVIVSCELAYRFVAGLEDCEVLEDEGDRVLVHQVIDQGWLMPTFDFVFESLRRPWERIEVNLVGGNLRTLKGYWQFTEMAEGTLVEHELRVRPAAPVPRFLVRRNIERTVPDLLACIRGLADGSGAEAQRKIDLARCPGPGSPSS